MKRITDEEIQKEALKYKTRSEFAKNNRYYWAAQRRGTLDKVCQHMVSPRHKPYTKAEIMKIAKGYSTRGEFFKNGSAYQAAKKMGIFEKACAHMTSCRTSWTEKSLAKLALNFNYRADFKNAQASAYATARNRGILDKICKHMEPSRVRPFTKKELADEAKKYTSRKEFENCSPSKYMIALRWKIMDEICKHMKKSSNASLSEQNLFDIIKEKFPKTQKFRDRKIKINGKPYIKGFDIDIYIPELRKGVEFDGKYWHSILGLKRSRIDWPEEDIKNYHKIKDEYFKSKGIEIIHVDETSWNKDKEKMMERILTFLGEKQNG